jgi:hypothetical protein
MFFTTFRQFCCVKLSLSVGDIKPVARFFPEYGNQMPAFLLVEERQSVLYFSGYRRADSYVTVRGRI